MPRRPFIPRFTRPSDSPLAFPGAAARNRPAGGAGRGDSPRDPAGEVLAAFANVSRRINDLARELKCLGFFDDGDDRPRAA